MHRIRYCIELTSSLLLKHLLNLLLLNADVTSLSRTLASAMSIYPSTSYRDEVGVKWDSGSLFANYVRTLYYMLGRCHRRDSSLESEIHIKFSLKILKIRYQL
jgi:hypothetical protein